jgi:hypothetical protein
LVVGGAGRRRALRAQQKVHQPFFLPLTRAAQKEGKKCLRKKAIPLILYLVWLNVYDVRALRSAVLRGWLRG